jgi:hypothetical protein
LINRLAAIALAVCVVVLVGGLAIEISMHELIFEDYLSFSFGWIVIAGIARHVTRPDVTMSAEQTSRAACEQPTRSDEAARS